jgi:hypothetical protein
MIAHNYDYKKEIHHQLATTQEQDHQVSSICKKAYADYDFSQINFIWPTLMVVYNLIRGGCFFCSAEQVVPFGLSLRHPTRVYEDLRRKYWENLQEEKLMNDRSAFNDKCYKWKHNCYRITCTESSIVVMLFCAVVLRCLLFMNETVDARKVVITLHTQKK